MHRSERESGHDCSFLDGVIDAERVSFDPDDRADFAADWGPHDPHLPDAVVRPASVTDVSRVLSAANEREVPVTPWSGGSSIEGNPIPVEGGIVLDTYGMDAVEVRPADLQAVVGPGIVYDELNEKLREHGLRFAPGIAAGDLATIGGMIANNASGLNAVRYGVTRDHVRRLEVVLPDGRVVECGRDVAKTAAGYSLKDLFVGSEGTLGVITEATLALEAIPTEKRAALVTFETPNAACEAVASIMREGLTPGAIEYVDTSALEAINAYRGDVSLAEVPTLIIELHGHNAGIEDDVALVRDRCEESDATGWESAGEEEMDRIWQARRDAYPAAREYRADGDVAVIGDVVVPISRYPDIVEAVAEIAADLDVPTPCVGHAGDGNLHFLPVADPDDEAAVERALELNDRVVDRALSLGGTSTGEHGIGMGKREFLRRESPEAVKLMAAIKHTIDPNGIMNPRKVLPDPDPDTDPSLDSDPDDETASDPPDAPEPGDDRGSDA